MVFNEYSTIDGARDASETLKFSSDDGFAKSGNPLAGPSSILSEGFFTYSGPYDHGALFDFGFGPGAARSKSRTFHIFYGAAGSEADAVTAVAAAQAEVWSFGEPSTPDGPTLGTPNTFIFGFSGVGGAGSRRRRPPTGDARDERPEPPARRRERIRSRGAADNTKRAILAIGDGSVRVDPGLGHHSRVGRQPREPRQPCPRNRRAQVLRRAGSCAPRLRVRRRPHVRIRHLRRFRRQRIGRRRTSRAPVGDRPPAPAGRSRAARNGRRSQALNSSTAVPRPVRRSPRARCRAAGNAAPRPREMEASPSPSSQPGNTRSKHGRTRKARMPTCPLRRRSSTSPRAAPSRRTSRPRPCANRPPVRAPAPPASEALPPMGSTPWSTGADPIHLSTVACEHATVTYEITQACIR